MIQYPDGHEPPLRSGATGSTADDSRPGPGNIPMDVAAEISREQKRTWNEVMGGRKPSPGPNRRKPSPAQQFIDTMLEGE